MNLTYLKNSSTSITATWDTPEDNSLQYRYNITLDNITFSSDSKSITVPNLVPGTKYTLNVSAFVPACSEIGETTSISAYTCESKIPLFLSIPFLVFLLHVLYERTIIL